MRIFASGTGISAWIEQVKIKKDEKTNNQSCSCKENIRILSASLDKPTIDSYTDLVCLLRLAVSTWAGEVGKEIVQGKKTFCASFFP